MEKKELIALLEQTYIRHHTDKWDPKFDDEVWNAIKDTIMQRLQKMRPAK